MKKLKLGKRKLKVDLFKQEAERDIDNSLEEIKEKAQEAVDLERQIDRIQDSLKEMKDQVLVLKREVLPDLFGKVGMTQLQLEDGGEIKISTYVSGSLPKDPPKKLKALTYMRSKAPELIKANTFCEFPIAENDRAEALYKQLTEEGYPAKLEKTIHHTTLCAFAREYLENGQDLPWELLGLSTGRVAKIKI